jgi:FMN reductase
VTIPCTVLAGHPRPGSRTFRVALQTAQALHEALLGELVDLNPIEVVDLAALGPLLPLAAGAAAPPAPPVQQALSTVSGGGLLIVASPTFKGSYTGLLKLFVDLLPMHGLERTVAVAVMTSGWQRHRGAAEHFLRPLLTELGARVPAPGLSVLESELADLSPVLQRWIGSHAPTVASVVARLCATAKTVS